MIYINLNNHLRSSIYISNFSETLSFTYKGYPQNSTLSPGRYKLRVWGAQSGYISNLNAGHG